MNVLYDHQIFSWQKYGGISRYFYELIKRVSVSERVDLYQGFHVNKYGLEKIGDFGKLFSCQKIELPKTGRIYEWINTAGLKCFARKSKAGIYHPTYYNDYCIDGKKLVVTVYDMIHELFPEYFVHDKATIAKKRVILKKADGIIAISEATKNDLVEILGLPPEKIDVVYLANSLRLEVKEKRFFKEPYCLYVGNRGGYKNFLPMLEAFAISKYAKDLKLVAFGGGAFDNKEISAIKHLNLMECVKQISGDDKLLANLYKYAEVFIYPSQYEGFGLPPLEAMYYGTPVICSDTSSIPEVVMDTALQFNPNNIDSMADAFNKILSDDGLRKELAVKGKNREKDFSWDRCAKETIDVYKKVLEG
ncbi:glycosyltransferase family 1 protein [Selenomonas ruminantium]|uniref:glycosyltransferase family 4 protein n=1 Tax=Selenomonas ruminantium TaxID=971 RepID=UPI0026EE17A9|nr:glycosyltransferase family 1 protein [Selenomonas ruminantium]